MVWKLVLPVGLKDNKYGKWSSNWEGPYRVKHGVPGNVLPVGLKDNKYGKWPPTWDVPYQVKHCVLGNAYILETLDGEIFPRVLNGKYLKN